MKNEVIFSTTPPIPPYHHVVRGERKTEFSQKMKEKQGKIEELERIPKK